MALRSVFSNWALTGGIIAVFAGLAVINSTAPSGDEDETPSEASSPVENPVSLPEDPIELAEESEPEIEPIPAPEPSVPSVLSSTSRVFLTELSVCGSMNVANRPTRVEDLQITNYQPTVSINGVSIAVAPVEAACFSSGFGPRGDHLHKGIDLHNSDPVTVFAAASGSIKEMHYRDDYGNLLVIDHGDGVFTRYAHLQAFDGSLEVYGNVEAGTPIGVMGNTASYSIPRHLHYEALTGEWGALSGSFGLTAVNIMAQLPEN